MTRLRQGYGVAGPPFFAKATAWQARPSSPGLRRGRPAFTQSHSESIRERGGDGRHLARSIANQ